MWGKTDLNGISRARGGPAWNPLLAHCLDAGAVCGKLFDDYLSAPVRARLAEAYGGGCERTARAVLMLLVALHDMPGKSQPGFLLQFPASTDPLLRAAGQRWKAAARRIGLPLTQRRVAPPHAHVTARYLPALLGCPCTRCAYGPSDKGAVTPHAGLHTVAAILGGHHGHIPDACRIADADCALPAGWEGIHRALLRELARLLRVDLDALPRLIAPQRPSALPLLAGLTVLSDWVASDESRFTYRTLETSPQQWWDCSRRQADTAVKELRLQRWQPLPASWAQLFPGTPVPRPGQQAVIDAVPGSGPFMAIIESDTGSGKTEAALWLAHHLTLQRGYHGIYLAQATRAASEQLSGRMGTFIEHAQGNRKEANLALVHGTASASAVAQELLEAGGPADFAQQVNVTDPDCTEDPYETARAVLDEWFLHARRGLLSPFGIGTVDQIVLAAQSARHWFLRLFGLANKVVIVDEAHAYQLFQQRHLGNTIAWLADAGASVVVLSATLPHTTRRALIDAWCTGHRTTPTEPSATAPITFIDATGNCRSATPTTTAANKAPKLRTRLRLVTDPGCDQLARTLLTKHRDGITGVVRNRVATATSLYTAAVALAAELGWDAEKEILLLHARFLERDRARHQNRLLSLLGPHPDEELRATTPNPDRPRRFLTIGTQVLQQSLDYDLDHLYSDLCPFDLLIQRRGRQWRHWINRLHLRRSTPLMHVLWTPGPDGLPLVHDALGRPTDCYAPYIMAATWHALHQRMPVGRTLRLTIPDDTHPLLQAVYAATPESGSAPIHTLLERLFDQWQQALDEEQRQADDWSIAPYNTDGSPCGIEDLASGHSHGEADDLDRPSHLIARSRLGEPGIDVVCLYEHPSGDRSWDPEGRLPADLTPYRPRTHAAERRLQQSEMILNSVPVPAHWLRGRQALPAATTWTFRRPGALKGRPALLLGPSGHPIEQHLAQLTYHPDTGLSRSPRATT